ncbi:MAG: hypothetical protein M1812_002773 [Candelaria pacifica]|nr:MAG: hypothetical protein M1812_002773 [Candelaria pacifica]
MILTPRYCDYYGNCDGYGNGYYSSWDSWGRWVVLAAILVGFFLLFVLCSCITSRRRRRNGLTPYRGTGWAAGKTPPGHAPATYTGAPQPGYGGEQYNQAAPPMYSPPPANNGYYGNNNAGYGANQSYFGGGQQQTGIELQQPQHAYQPASGGDPVYQAPPGAPPAKNDGIIR